MSRKAAFYGGFVFGATYLVAAALYFSTAARAPGPGDWGDFVAAASVLGIAHPTGYPVYLQFLALPLLAFPATWAAAAADVTNALFVAAAPALLAWGIYRAANGGREASWSAAAFASLTGVFFAAAPAVWFEATAVEVYGAGLAFLSAGLFLLEAARRRADDRLFLAASFVGGLAVGVHLTSFAYLFVLLVIWAGMRRPSARIAWGAVAAWALGLSATLYLPLRSVVAPLTWSWTGAPDLPAVARHALGRQFSYNFRWPTWLLVAFRLRELAAAAWQNGGPLVLLAPLGAWVLGRRSRFVAAAITAVAALNVVFLLFYDIPDLASYRLPFVSVVFACGGAAALALFRATRGKFRAAAALVAAAAVTYAVAHEWPRQRREPEFMTYYSRRIVTPVGYRGLYFSGATTSNFIYWYRQYPLRQRPDIELYNLNDERYDLDKLAGIIWRERDVRPVFADYYFVFQTHQRRVFCRRGRPAGFVLELVERETSPVEGRPLDADVLARAEAWAEGRRFEPGRPSSGLDIAISIWGYHGTFYDYRDDPARARFFLERGAELAPEVAMPHVNLAQWHFERGAYEEAREAARAALAADFGPNTYMAYAYLAMVEQATGDLDAAAEYARRAVALKPHDGKTHRLLAGVYMARGENGKAQRELEATLAAGYNDPDTVLMLAARYRAAGREAEAFALLEENVHDFNDHRLLNAYALALIERGRYVEAKQELERALRIAPDSPEVRGNLARLEARGW